MRRSKASKATPAKPKRVRAPQQRTVETRDKIIAAAMIEFSTHGHDGTSIRSIAQRAGIPHTLVTYHFGSKEALSRECFVAAVRRQKEMFEDRMEGLRGVDEATKLRLDFQDFIEACVAKPHVHQLLDYFFKNPSPQLEKALKEYIAPVAQARVALIKSAQKTGDFISGDPYHLYYLFLGAASRIFMLSPEVKSVTGKSPFDKTTAKRHIDLCLGLFFPKYQGRD